MSDEHPEYSSDDVARHAASPRRFVRPPLESAEVTRVRRLLAELRPYGPGPTEPLEGPSGASGGVLAGVAGRRPPWAQDVPWGAFRRDREGEAALRVVERIARVPSPRARSALAWLRRSGTLSHGYGWLATALAGAICSPDQAASWAADRAHGRDRRRAWGAARLEEACAAWDAAAAAPQKNTHGS